ncbi:MAG: threonine synthase [Verrucomicrobiia bacterium]
MAIQHISHLRCIICGEKYPADNRYTCDKCGVWGILDVEYDYAKVAKTLTRQALAQRPHTHWRYEELIPIDFSLPLPRLQIGYTPVYHTDRLNEWVGVRDFYLKDDGRNPSASFKDRASSVGVMKAIEYRAKTISTASTGNAASSLACCAAAVGLSAFIFVPEKAPEPKIAQLLVFGSTVIKVKGNYDAATDFCMDACAKYGWYNRNCAINSYLVEGKKTCGLEIAEQFSDMMPDWVCLSVGDGCTIAGTWKGIREMHQLGFIKKLPRMLGVQATGCKPIADAFHSGKELVPVEGGTRADSIDCGTPRNWRKAVQAIRESHGEIVAVSDAEIMDAMNKTARLSGVFGEPSGAASVAGVKRAVADGIIKKGESVCAVITGNGLKDIKAAIETAGSPIHIAPDLGALDKELKKRKVL